MTQRRVTATRQLSTVINVIQLGKKTGLLTVERGEGATFEEGTMTFLQGQVVNAVLGTLRGRDAAAALSVWQACHFAFAQMQPHELGNQTGPLARTTSSPSHTNPTPPPTGQSFTPQPFPYQVNRSRTSGEFPAIQAQPEHYLQPRMGNDLLQSRPRIAITTHSTDAIIQAMDRQGYSRLHRRLYLLIDGNRSVLELGNLVGRPIDETIAMLSDLERAGLIQQ